MVVRTNVVFLQGKHWQIANGNGQNGKFGREDEQKDKPGFETPNLALWPFGYLALWSITSPQTNSSPRVYVGLRGAQSSIVLSMRSTTIFFTRGALCRTRGRWWYSARQ